MGRPPSNGGPSFRFNQAEIVEMEAILQAHKTAMPAREVLVSLAEKFSNSEERKGKIEVQMKQVWNWFQNRRYAIRAKAAKSPGKLNVTQMTRDDSGTVKGVPQATQPHVASSTTVRSLPQGQQHPTVPSVAVRTFPQAPQHPAAFTVQSAGRVTENSQLEYEAKSARDGAWYDVSTFLSHRSLETGDPEVLVRFAGFGAEEDEWVNVRKNVRQRSLPCESSECVAVLPADLILCFQEGKEQALYFDAHVLDAQRRRHDVRGCRCRFLVRYDHDQSEEIVALRKICRRPETDYRLQQLHAVNESLSANHNKNGGNNIHTVSTLRVYPPAEVPQPKQHKVEPVVSSSPVGVPQKRQRVDLTVPAPQPEGSQQQFKVEPVVLETMLPDPSPQKVESKVLVLPAPSVDTQNKGKLEEPDSSSVKGSTELHEVQPEGPDQPVLEVVETKPEEPVVPASTNGPNMVEEAKTEEPMVAKTEEPVVTKTEEPVSTGDPNVVEEAIEAKTEEPVVPVSTGEEPIVAKTEEPMVNKPMVPVSTGDPMVVEEAKTEEPMVPVSTGDPNVFEAVETKTEEPVSTSDPNVVEEAKTDESVSTGDPNVAGESKTEEPVSTGDPDVVEEVKTEEPVSTGDPNVAEEAKTEEPVSTSDPNGGGNGMEEG